MPVNSQAAFCPARDLLIANCLSLSRSWSVERDSGDGTPSIRNSLSPHLLAWHFIPFPDNNRHISQTVGPRCSPLRAVCRGRKPNRRLRARGCAAIIPGGAAAPPYPLHRLSLGFGISHQSASLVPGCLPVLHSSPSRRVAAKRGRAKALSKMMGNKASNSAAALSPQQHGFTPTCE